MADPTPEQLKAAAAFAAMLVCVRRWIEKAVQRG